MKVLIIGLGKLGNHVLNNFLNNGLNNIEVYTRDISKYINIKNDNVVFLSKINEAKQPDVIFITANLYKPEDRLKYLENNFNTDKYFNVRDDESNKNQLMILDIVKNLKHLKEVPLIITANPPELLIKVMHDELGWKSIYNMQMMLDNKRISKITNLNENDCLCVGEHGNPTPTLNHIKKVDQDLYKNINLELSKIITKIHLEHKGTPPLIDAEKSLDVLIQSILSGKELNCVLTTYDDETKTGFGKPFTVKGLNFQEKDMPELSEFESLLLKETKEKLIKKWSNIKENISELKIK